MRFFKSNKMQISIFLLIGVMIIFLIVFLVNTEVEDKTKVIEENRDLSGSNSNLDSNFIGLKEIVDSCLEKELKKSLIVAGAKGGFIYENGEYYFPGVWPDNLYSESTIKNLGLTSSYLSKSTLVYSRDMPDYIPRYNSEDIYFQSLYFERTIDEDIHRFILNGFLECVDIKGMEQRGYNVTYEQYLGRIESIDFDKITLFGVIGNVNDTVKLDTIENIYFGKITKVNLINKQTEVEFKDSNIVFPDSTSFSEFNVINVNSSVKLNITFQDEAVSASLVFPITISKGDFTSTYKNSEVSVNVRLKQLLKLSRNLISYKYNKDHLIDFTDREVLNEFLEGTKGDKNSYFKTTNNRELYITKKILKNSDDHKAEVYTIIDYDSKIFGEPYVYSFGYENHAPIIDLTRIEDFMINDEKEGIIGRVGKNKPFTYNFLLTNNGTIDPQLNDNFRNNWGGKNTPNNWTDNYVHFKEQHYVSTESKFDLYENGTINFIGYVEKMHEYKVEITDGEASNSYNFKIRVGAPPENTDNVQAVNCFEFKPFEHNAFPIDKRIAGIHSFISSSKTKVYAYQNYINPSTGISGNSELKFFSSCVSDPNVNVVKYSINGVEMGKLSSPYIIEISSSINTVQNVKVTILDLSGKALTDPYEITIYPASCLGPAVDDSNILAMKNVGAFGTAGIGTCCDITSVLNSISSNQPKAFTTGANKNLKSSLEQIANPAMYFTFALESDVVHSSITKSLIHVKYKGGSLNDFAQLRVGDKFFDGKIIAIDTKNNITKVKLESSLDEIKVAYESLGATSIYSSNNVSVYFAGGVVAKDYPIALLTGFYDSENNNIWESFTSDATALYSGNVIFSCQGVFPRFQENVLKIESSSSSDFVGNIVSYSTSGYKKSFTSNFPLVTMKKIKDGGVCKFNLLDAKSEFKVLIDVGGKKIPMDSGLISLNDLSKVYGGPLPSSGEGSNLLVLCDNKWFATDNNLNWFNAGVIGMGGTSGSLYKSKGYCSAGSVTCTGKVNSPTYSFIASDDSTSCIDNYFNLGTTGTSGNLDISQTPAPKTWTCGYYTSCNKLNIITNVIKCGGILECPVFPSVTNCKGSCNLNGVSLENGESKTFYSVSSSYNCDSYGAIRTCDIGTLTGSNTYNLASCLPIIDCAGYYKLDSGSCSASCEDGGGNFDKEWITTTYSANGGISCPANTFYDNGGIECNRPGSCLVDGDCGTSHAINSYIQPTTNLCLKGTYQDDIDTSLEFKWKCVGENLGATDFCFANKKIDCNGYYDSNYGSCSATSCAVSGNYDKKWITTIFSSNGGAECTSIDFIDNGGNTCMASGCRPFISLWDTTKLSSGSSASNQVKLPLTQTGNYNFNVDWGDGVSTQITSWNQAEVTHTYLTPGIYEIKITGTIKGFGFVDRGDKLKIFQIKQWGNLNLGNEGHNFYGCSNLNSIATDVLDLSGTTSLAGMFYGASSFNGDISNWDVSQVINTNSMFYGASSFNGDISNWDVSQVITMDAMFKNARNFNQPLDTWDVSKVISMSSMFSGASSFNQPLNNWDVSKVTIMTYMFEGASSFNQPLDTWDVSKVITMMSMFYGASSFNGDISNWDVSQVTNMNNMFVNARNFNQPLNNWDVSKVISMNGIFQGASSFNQPLNNWDVSQVTNMLVIFYDASSFNQPLNNWDVSQVTNMYAMFNGASSFNQPLDTWDVSQVTNMDRMFTGAVNFNQPLDTWDVSKVISMSSMFQGATSFNQPLNNWDVSSVTSTAYMFQGATSFNQPLDTWDVSLVTNMAYMFQAAVNFNQPLDTWDVSSVTSMENMFYNARTFNQPLDTWDVNSVTNMLAMFYDASSFNGDISDWDVSKVTTMYSMFKNARSFNQPLNNWDVSHVTSCIQFSVGASSWSLSKPNFTRCVSS